MSSCHPPSPPPRAPPEGSWKFSASPTLLSLYSRGHLQPYTRVRNLSGAFVVTPSLCPIFFVLVSPAGPISNGDGGYRCSLPLPLFPYLNGAARDFERLLAS